MTTTTPGLRDLGDEEFVQLTTFKRSGAPVLRQDSRVELRPCSRRGHVEKGGPRVTAVAALDPDPDAHEREADRFASKYGWQYQVAMVVERVIVAVRRTTGPARRIVRITTTEATPGLPTTAI